MCCTMTAVVFYITLRRYNILSSISQVFVLLVPLLLLLLLLLLSLLRILVMLLVLLLSPPLPLLVATSRAFLAAAGRSVSDEAAAIKSSDPAMLRPFLLVLLSRMNQGERAILFGQGAGVQTEPGQLELVQRLQLLAAN